MPLSQQILGMVEIVSDSKTFREIQSSYGLTGAFKDRPIAEWLQKYNPTGLSYERVSKIQNLD